MAITKYYYFYKERVFSSYKEISNSAFEKLSDDMITFYLANLTASKTEIQNCQLTQIKETVIDVEEYRTKKLKTLENLSLSTSNSKLPGWKITNAVIDAYDSEKKTTVLLRAQTLAQTCIAEYDRVAALINAAETVEEIDTAFNQNNYATME